MDKSLFVAMNGARRIELAQTVHANNMANASTHGFKADMEVAHSHWLYGDGFQSRHFSSVQVPVSDTSNGAIRHTGRSLDVAVQNNDWLVVEDQNGAEALSRAGALQIDENGFLVTANRFRVIGSGGPISLPAADSVEIARDGSISVSTTTNGATTQSTVDRFKLVTVEDGSVQKGQDGLFRQRAEDGSYLTEYEISANAQAHGGSLEDSNVNVVSELTQMIALAREFELQIKTMKNFEEADQQSARLLQVSS